MAWNQILGHDREKKILQKAILEKRIAHAYCLWGIEGIGKDGLALEFAKTVNCSNPRVEAEEINACGECKDCRMMSNMSHPHLSFVMPLPAGKGNDGGSDSSIAKMSDDQINEMKEQLLAKSADYYHKINIANANTIKIASIRELKRNLTMSSGGSGRRVVIISQAQEMNSEAANAFLKTLEEPHDNVTIFITSSKKESLLQTILSRCQQVHCSPISDEIIANALIQKHGTDIAEARIAAVFAQGSFTKALGSLGEDTKSLRNEVTEMLRTSLKKNNYRIDLLSNIDGFTKSKDKNLIETALRIMLLWLRDAYSISKTGIGAKIINIDQSERIQKFAALFPNADYIAAIDEIENSLSKIRRNVNLNLILITLFLKFRQIFLRIYT